MAEELRRSTRVRKQVKTYAEEQAEQDELAITAPPMKRKKSIAKSIKTESQDEFGIKADPDAAIKADPDVAVKAEPDTILVKPEPCDVAVKAEPDTFKLESDAYSETEEDTAGDSSSDAEWKHRPPQAYGAPPMGAPIPGPLGRMWKQPQVWKLDYKSYGGGKKKIKFDDMTAEQRIAKTNISLKRLKPGEVESRAKPRVNVAKSLYNEYLERATEQKMFVLGRIRGCEENCHAGHDDCPFEVLQIAGSKGNVYTVNISHLTRCSCPAGTFKNHLGIEQCKHIIYVLHLVLKAPDHLKCQSAFLTSELKELFANAPALPTEVVEAESMDGNRKPIEGECPICFMDFEPGEDTVWCRAACGNNLHKPCFGQWAAEKERAMTRVTCPFCRTEWQKDDAAPKRQQSTMANVDLNVARGASGYRNVADQLDY